MAKFCTLNLRGHWTQPLLSRPRISPSIADVLIFQNKQINNSEVPLFLASILEKSGSFPRGTSHVKPDDNNNLQIKENNFKGGKLLIYSHDSSPSGQGVMGKQYYYIPVHLFQKLEGSEILHFFKPAEINRIKAN